MFETQYEESFAPGQLAAITLMPLKNHFRHQLYNVDEPAVAWRLIDASFPAQPGSDGFASSVTDFSRVAEEDLDAIWFVHGTFAGNDALGWFSQFERMIPAAGPVLKNFGKKITDLLAGDSGNFTKAFIDLIEVAIPTRRFVWSGENTHSGRCKAAIELLDELLQRVPKESRVMLCGHSHAGNVAALITNLLGAEAWVQEKFLDLVEPLFPIVDDRMCALQRVRSAVESGALVELQLDVVNFGAPITYGWDSAGYRRLLHFVNHVPQPGQPEWLCPLIEAGKNWRDDTRGDLVQILGITGSDFLPWLLNRTTRDVEAKLHQFLAADFSRRDWWSRASRGIRVADEGETVLVQYENKDGHASETLGHSVYTKPEWLAFHLNLVAEQYQLSPGS